MTLEGLNRALSEKGNIKDDRSPVLKPLAVQCPTADIGFNLETQDNLPYGHMPFHAAHTHSTLITMPSLGGKPLGGFRAELYDFLTSNPTNTGDTA